MQPSFQEMCGPKKLLFLYTSNNKVNNPPKKGISWVLLSINFTIFWPNKFIQCLDFKPMGSMGLVYLPKPNVGKYTSPMDHMGKDVYTFPFGEVGSWGPTSLPQPQVFKPAMVVRSKPQELLGFQRNAPRTFNKKFGLPVCKSWFLTITIVRGHFFFGVKSPKLSRKIPPFITNWDLVGGWPWDVRGPMLLLFLSIHSWRISKIKVALTLPNFDWWTASWQGLCISATKV